MAELVVVAAFLRGKVQEQQRYDSSFSAFPIFLRRRSNISRSSFERTLAASSIGGVFPKGPGDERAALRREFDQAHAPVVGILPFHKRSFSPAGRSRH